MHQIPSLSNHYFFGPSTFNQSCDKTKKSVSWYIRDTSPRQFSLLICQKMGLNDGDIKLGDDMYFNAACVDTQCSFEVTYCLYCGEYYCDYVMYGEYAHPASKQIYINWHDGELN